MTPAAPWRVKEFSVQPGYRLAVTFQDGVAGIVDCSGVLGSSDAGVFAPLSSPEFFARAALELGVVTWPNGADLDPHWMHDGVVRDKTWRVPF